MHSSFGHRQWIHDTQTSSRIVGKRSLVNGKQHGHLLSRFFLDNTGERLCGDKRQTSARLPSVNQNKKYLYNTETHNDSASELIERNEIDSVISR